MEHVENDFKKSKKVIEMIECFLKNSVSVTIHCSLVWFETLELVCNFFRLVRSGVDFSILWILESAT
jgi:hypothetical protein